MIADGDLLAKMINLSEIFDKFQIQSLTGRTSNGYLEFIFRQAALDLINV